MHCNNDIHIELEDEYTVCPFCNKEIGEHEVKQEACCDNQNMIKDDNGGNICKNCDVFHGYDYATEYIDFNTNKHKINKKSIYYRKYHLYNKIDSLVNDKKYHITYNERERVIKILKEIDKILPQINQNRKRMININFSLNKIFNALKTNIKRDSNTKI